MAHTNETESYDGADDRSDGSYKGQTIPAGVDHRSFPSGEPVRASDSRGSLDDLETSMAPAFEKAHSASAQTDYDPGFGQATMQPAAYYTVEYPVGFLDPCTNLTGTCQCNDCTWIGCLTHDGHNGVALEPPPPPNEYGMPLADAEKATPQDRLQTQIATHLSGPDEFCVPTVG